jgi:hypothetical protein
MDGHHSPPAAQPEAHGSFNYDIESTDGPWRGAGAGQDRSSEALLRYDDRYDDDGPREPLLRKRTMNTTSQIAIVGANVCPIESLDYEYALHTNRPSLSPPPWLRWLILSTSRKLPVLIRRRCLVFTVFSW